MKVSYFKCESSSRGIPIINYNIESHSIPKTNSILELVNSEPPMQSDHTNGNCNHPFANFSKKCVSCNENRRSANVSQSSF